MRNSKERKVIETRFLFQLTNARVDLMGCIHSLGDARRVVNVYKVKQQQYFVVHFKVKLATSKFHQRQAPGRDPWLRDE